MKKILKREVFNDIKNAVGDFDKMSAYIESLDTQYYYKKEDVDNLLTYISNNIDVDKESINKRIHKIMNN